MKIVTDNTTTIERIGVGTDQSFKINFDAKMARILADGLYSDKVQSVIRELSCNAYDSHVMAGCADRPIEVHFPNRFEPFFYVEDFGLGLSHDNILNIYTTYGASTKTASNEVMGQLGLGSKSPFSLTDAFTVTARKDGAENHYSMYRNEQGMPSVAHLHSKPTDLGNGVRVTVPVKSDQRDEFITKAREVYKWFPVKPHVLGDTITFPEIEYSYQGHGWGIREYTTVRNGYYGSRTAERPVAVMGLVAYPLDLTSIKNLPQGAAHLMSTPVVLNFEIGDLEVAANREALGYDDRTCANIVSKICAMTHELGQTFEKEIGEAKSLWYAHQKFGEIFTRHEYAYEFSNAFKNLGLKYKNTVVKSDYYSVKFSDLYPKTVLHNNDYMVEAGIYEASSRYKRPRKVTTYQTEEYSVRCESNMVVMFNDLKLGGMTRAMEYNRGFDNRKYLVIFNPSTVASWADMLRLLGNPDVIYTSTLPKPARAKSTTSGILQYTGNMTYGKKAWDQTTIDLDNPGNAYYVEMDGWDVKRGDSVVTDLKWYIRAAKEAGIIPQDAQVYAMRNKNKKLVREHNAWKELFTTVKASVEEHLKVDNVAQKVADREEYRRMTQNCHGYWWESVFDIKADDSLFTSFCNKVKSVSDAKKSSAIETIETLSNRLGIVLDKVTPQYNLTGELQAVLARYPMLYFADNRSSYRNLDNAAMAKIADYINMVDACRVFYALQDDPVEE